MLFFFRIKQSWPSSKDEEIDIWGLWRPNWTHSVKKQQKRQNQASQAQWPLSASASVPVCALARLSVWLDARSRSLWGTADLSARRDLGTTGKERFKLRWIWISNACVYYITPISYRRDKKVCMDQLECLSRNYSISCRIWREVSAVFACFWSSSYNLRAVLPQPLIFPENPTIDVTLFLCEDNTTAGNSALHQGPINGQLGSAVSTSAPCPGEGWGYLPCPRSLAFTHHGPHNLPPFGQNLPTDATTALGSSLPDTPSLELPTVLLQTHALGSLGMQTSTAGPALDLSVVQRSWTESQENLSPIPTCCVTLGKPSRHTSINIKRLPQGFSNCSVGPQVSLCRSDLNFLQKLLFIIKNATPLGYMPNSNILKTNMLIRFARLTHIAQILKLFLPSLCVCMYMY